jgi:alpha-N-arabinofuranosidase
VEEWYELLREADKVESLIEGHWAVMGELDPTHKVKLVVDEWGSWHRAGTEAHPTHLLGQVSTLRDALVAGLSLDAFVRNADKVAMANLAQLVNCLHALFVAHEDRFFVTPNYHVFDMYAAHQNGQAVRTVFSAPPVRHTRLGQPATFRGLLGSASVRDRRAVLTVVNPDAREAREAEIAWRGATVRSAQARVLTASDIHAHNSFDDPRALEPVDTAVPAASGASFAWRFPAASVTRLLVDLV